MNLYAFIKGILSFNWCEFNLVATKVFLQLDIQKFHLDVIPSFFLPLVRINYAIRITLYVKPTTIKWSRVSYYLELTKSTWYFWYNEQYRHLKNKSWYKCIYADYHHTIPSHVYRRTCIFSYRQIRFSKL